MCHALDALPPIAPLAGAAVDSRDLTLTSADGTQFAAFLARSAKPGSPGIVVLPDVRGLYRFYEELALRFAEHGLNAVAIDYFGRTAGVGKRDEAFPFMEHVMQTRADTISADVGAAVAYLGSPDGGSSSAVFTVGFCFGGANSWLQAASGHSLAGVIGFYGRPGAGRDGSPGPQQRAAEFKAPVLALMGGADQSIPQDQVGEYEQALKSAGVEHEVVVYPGAPHSFFDRSADQHADAAADAWQRALDFVAKHSRKA
ncbi:MAG: dienelactone hydrolase family protein [Chloroflexota bacterium]|nr:dienelactone hydrolase family protein [Chloroflexota bacterium]